MKDNKYKQIKKQYRRDRLKKFFNNINYFHQLKHKREYAKAMRENSAPDISTITEHIAFVIDGEIVEIIHCQPKMAAILLSEPELIEIPQGEFAEIGWKYKDGKFVKPKKKDK